jgi:lysyl-tRNA synthetase class 1
LEIYAPAHLRFKLQEELPEIKLGSNQVVFLANLARFMEETTGDPETIHARIHELKDAHNLSARDAFQAIYLVLLGQTSGPKAGWYLTTLDRAWLTSRLRLET